MKVGAMSGPEASSTQREFRVDRDRNNRFGLVLPDDELAVFEVVLAPSPPKSRTAAR